MNYPIVIDLETKYTFRDFSDPKKLEITVIGVYNYKDNSLKGYFESDLPAFYPVLESASIIIGFNINSFDLPVLSGYYPGSISQFHTFDIIEDIKDKIGKRLALNDLIYATLGLKKTGHGLHAIELYKQKKLKELQNYCLDDVSLTQKLFDYGSKNNEVHYLTSTGKQTIPVNWKKYLSSKSKTDLSLTLPF